MQRFDSWQYPDPIMPTLLSSAVSLHSDPRELAYPADSTATGFCLSHKCSVPFHATAWKVPIPMPLQEAYWDFMQTESHPALQPDQACGNPHTQQLCDMGACSTTVTGNLTRNGIVQLCYFLKRCQVSEHPGKQSLLITITGSSRDERYPPTF